jgi:hypothetical protein
LQEGSLKYLEGEDEIFIDQATRAFSLPAGDVTISAFFEPLPQGTYSVSAAGDPEHGVIAARPEFGIPGTPVHLLVIPDPGYRYKSGSLKYNGNSVNDLKRSFTLPEKNVQVTAEFEPVPVANYTIRAGATKHGRIFTKPESSPGGEEVYLHIIPDPGYRLKEKSLDFAPATREAAVNERERTFTMPASHVTVHAEFTAVPADSYTVAVKNLSGGRVIPDRDYGKPGDPVYLHVIPDPGYALKNNSLTISGFSDPNNLLESAWSKKVDKASRVFTIPAGHVIVNALFKKLADNEYSVRVDMLDHGRITAAPEYGKRGTAIPLKIHPEAGYVLTPDSLRYTDTFGRDTPVDSMAKAFFLPANHVTVKAQFEKRKPTFYSVYPDYTPHGRITPVQDSGPRGAAVFLWLTPEPGFVYAAGSLKYGPLEQPLNKAVKHQTVTLPGFPVHVGAKFTAAADGNFTISVTPAAHGRIQAEPEFGVPGAAVTVKVSPDSGYRLKPHSLKYRGAATGDTTAISQGKPAFTMPGEHIIISGEFEALEYQVAINPGLENGKITARPAKGTAGTTITLRMKEDNGYRYKPGSLKYTGGPRKKDTGINGMSFILPAANVTVTADFVPSGSGGRDKPPRGKHTAS